MLMQNWFCQPNMEMFYEYFETQKFYDKNTKAIYVVENTGEGTRIREIQEGADNYNMHYVKYLEWKSDNMPVKLFVQECERYIENCTDDELDETYDTTIDITMLGLTTKIPFCAELHNRMIEMLKELSEKGEI